MPQDLVLKMRHGLRDRVCASLPVSMNLSAIARNTSIFLEFCQVQSVPPRGVLTLKMLPSDTSAVIFHDVLLVSARRYAKRLGLRSAPVSEQEQADLIRRWVK